MKPDLFEYIFFGLCALLALVGAVGTVAFPNPIRGALSLLFSIVAIAGLYLQLHAPFLAAIQMIVYAGAIVVLFLFVIMLIGPDVNPPRDHRGLPVRLASALAGLIVTGQIVAVLSQRVLAKAPTIQPGFGSVDAVGEVLFRDYLVPFEAASILLMVAIVGAVAVARGKQPDPHAEKATGPVGKPSMGRPVREVAAAERPGAHA